jgi:dihydrofolate reductase
MARVVVFNHVTLDGVMQAPGRPDEDRRGGFDHGGWAASRMDSEMAGAAARSMAQSTALLLGRRTYQDFADFWPKQKGNPFTEILNKAQKYVASRRLKEPLPWSNSTLLKGDAAAAVARLKKKSGKDLVVLGSGDLVQSLMRRNLIDEYILMIHPLVLGSGRRLFTGGAFAALELAEARPTPSGVLIATYRPANRKAKSG